MWTVDSRKIKSIPQAEFKLYSYKDTVNTARDQATNATQSVQESAQQGQQQTVGFLKQTVGFLQQTVGFLQQTAGFLQQTGEQMKGMTQGAVKSVKNILGMNEKK
ncbi:late embryogenesis abundant protein 1-like [Durio zibethinus]|uniref:Late embryogenesis abundant protein 1-like n=1 Tax=Durio zibethinus TaxID=66656 RepID=A0A6P6AM59_DURZI|nr:late embryogenesis abundant protein 1-like [Durio zibethinus]